MPSEDMPPEQFGSGLILVLAVAFAAVGGRPLVVTFLPGLTVVWGIFAGLCRSGHPLPEGRDLYPLYFGVLAWQFLHFLEEYLTGFRIRFPELYGAEPYSDGLFVGINMVSYFVFALAFVVATQKRLAVLYIPPLFFAVYGALGNAIAHPWWVIETGEYFPGAVTALAYWALGPLLLARFVGGLRQALIVAAGFALILIPCITFTTA